MKLIVISFLLISLSIGVRAQQGCHLEYSVNYYSTPLHDSLRTYNLFIADDQAIFMHNKAIPSYYRERGDGWITNELVQGDTTYTDLRNNYIVSLVNAYDEEGFFLLKEDVPKMNWVLSKEVKTIGKYICSKATLSYRGRDYEAWYTLMLPISFGPYKFHGLPGAIVEMKSVGKFYQFKLLSIKTVKVDSIASFFKEPSIGIPHTDYKTLYKTFDKYRHDKMEKWLAKMNAKFNPKYPITQEFNKDPRLIEY